MLKRLVCGPPNIHCAGFPGGSVVKNPPPAQGTWVQSLIMEDPLEKETATHSSVSCLEKRQGQRSMAGWSMRSQCVRQN